MYTFPIKPLTWTGSYYSRKDGCGKYVLWHPDRDEKLEKQTPQWKTSTSFYLTKTIEYNNTEILHRDIENLERLQEEKFVKIKVPEFTFEYKDNVLQYTCQFIKGKGCNLKRMDYIYDDVVLRNSEYSFVDYDPSNFIRVYQGEHDSRKEYGGSVYAIDLTSYQKMDIQKRIKFWKRKRTFWGLPTSLP